MAEKRISYVDPASVDDPAMIAEFERCAKFGMFKQQPGDPAKG